MVQDFLHTNPTALYKEVCMKNRKIKSIFKWSAFLIYIVALIYFVFFAEMLGRADVPVNYRYNLVPFKEIKRFIIYYRQIGINAVILNLAGNVVAFMPFGFFVPSLKNWSFMRVVLTGFLFSLAVETVQLVTKVGTFDVDDLFLNTIGVTLGCIMFYFCRKIFRAVRKKKGRER